MSFLVCCFDYPQYQVSSVITVPYWLQLLFTALVIHCNKNNISLSTKKKKQKVLGCWCKDAARQVALTQSILLDSNRYQSLMNIDFQCRSMKKKVVTLINIDDFPIEINDDFFIDYYRFLSIFIYFVKR